MCPSEPSRSLPAQRERATFVDIDRWNVCRVVDMPGLAHIDLADQVATLVFTTAPGADPVEPEFIASEVVRMIYGNVVFDYPGFRIFRDETGRERLVVKR